MSLFVALQQGIGSARCLRLARFPASTTGPSAHLHSRASRATRSRRPEQRDHTYRPCCEFVVEFAARTNNIPAPAPSPPITRCASSIFLAQLRGRLTKSRSSQVCCTSAKQRPQWVWTAATGARHRSLALDGASRARRTELTASITDHAQCINAAISEPSSCIEREQTATQAFHPTPAFHLGLRRRWYH